MGKVIKSVETRSAHGLYNVQGRKIPNSDFNDVDKRKLLAALKKYGHRNTKMLAKALPHKTEEQIKVFINIKLRGTQQTIHTTFINKRRFGKLTVGRRIREPEYIKAPIERWLYKMETARNEADIGENADMSKLLAKCMLFTSRFEAHPLLQDCGGINYRELYEYLYLVMSGYPPKRMSSVNSRVIMDCISRLADMVSIDKVEKEAMFIDKCQRVSYLQKGELRVYPSRRRVPLPLEGPGLSALREVVKIMGINPLNVPLDLLIKEEELDS